ncbi:type II toxin-antitoxin system HicB family antitoxin [uncultured Corynebacterium sp.]|uniref:type II toxin-antitoxin system HicB family antitoxin n=1 Tax=uncultured Corynebacterium sp. TaxID=159447 RepID=UPI00261544AA|nr:type II toxin-antitoxin system HicB family antitoxin [uncultured Corynebacterium sp.]
MTIYTARVKRSGDWWAVTVPQVPGLFTQGRTLAEIKDMVRRPLELYPEIEPDPDTARVVIQLGTPAGEEAAATATARAARNLVAQGLTYRDTAVLLDISHQRVAQLVSD